jgi:hypothetical protein
MVAVRARSVAINRCALPMIIRRFEPGLLAVRRSLAGRGAIAGKLRMQDVGYPVAFRLNDRKNDPSRPREARAGPKFRNPISRKSRPLSHATRRVGNAWMPPQSGCTRACITQGAGYPCELLHIDGTEKRGASVGPRWKRFFNSVERNRCSAAEIGPQCA